MRLDKALLLILATFFVLARPYSAHADDQCYTLAPGASQQFEVSTSELVRSVLDEELNEMEQQAGKTPTLSALRAAVAPISRVLAKSHTFTKKMLTALISDYPDAALFYLALHGLHAVLVPVIVWSYGVSAGIVFETAPTVMISTFTYTAIKKWRLSNRAAVIRNGLFCQFTKNPNQALSAKEARQIDLETIHLGGDNILLPLLAHNPDINPAGLSTENLERLLNDPEKVALLKENTELTPVYNSALLWEISKNPIKASQLMTIATTAGIDHPSPSQTLISNLQDLNRQLRVLIAKGALLPHPIFNVNRKWWNSYTGIRQLRRRLDDLMLQTARANIDHTLPEKLNDLQAEEVALQADVSAFGAQSCENILAKP